MVKLGFDQRQCPFCGEHIPTQLTDIAAKCREIVLRAQEALGPDLGGMSMLDLVADQITDLPLRTLEDALVIAGVNYKVKS